MKKIFEDAKIRNLNTQETTVIDDEGNIAEVGGLPGAEADPTFDMFADDDFNAAGNDGVGPDGTPDGLDEFFGGSSDEFGLDDELPSELDMPAEGGMEGEEELGGDEDLGMDEVGLGDEPGQEEDPDFQGVIRTVTGANLIYKRRNDEGEFEELWVYNVGKSMKAEAKIRRAILAGTDIGPQMSHSEDGTQSSESSSIGNVQFLKIVGLPN